MESISRKEKRHSDVYLFVFDRKSAVGFTGFWYCDRRGECKPSIQVQDGQIVKSLNVYWHEAFSSIIAKDVVVLNIKRSAKDTVELASEVINESNWDLSEACDRALLTQNAVRKLMRRARN